MSSPEEYKNPDRPISYEEYVASKDRVLKAEDIHHYFNGELFSISHKLLNMKDSVEESGLPTEIKQALLTEIKEIDDGHRKLQTIALDAIGAWAKVEEK